MPLVPMETLADLVHPGSRGEKETLASHLGQHLKERRETQGLLALLDCLAKRVGRDRKVSLVHLDSPESLECKVQSEAQVPKVILAGRVYRGL